MNGQSFVKNLADRHVKMWTEVPRDHFMSTDHFTVDALEAFVE